MYTNHPRVSAGKLVHKFAYNADVGTTFEPIWDQGGAYTFPASTGVQLSVASSSAADTGAGTGVQTVRVEGVDVNGEFFSEDITLTGTTEVPLTNTSVIAVNRMYALTVGTGGVNAGDIYVGDGVFTVGVPAEKFLKIKVGNGQTLHGIYTVPKDKAAYLLGWEISAARNGTADTDVRIRFRIDRGPWRVYEYHVLYQPEFADNFTFPHILGQADTYGIDIQVEALTSTGTQAMAASFDILEE
jgi:hypothetical protein